MGIATYITLEMLGSVCLQYVPSLQGQDQLVIIVLRLLECLGFGFLIYHFRLVESLGLHKPNAQALRIFLLLAIICTSLAGLLYLIYPQWFQYVVVPNWLHGVVGLFLMVVLAPVTEELIFRGLLYRMLREQWGVAVSIIVSAVFFSLVHHGMIVSPQLAGGLIFAFAYEWSRSLWVSIGLHMGANAAVYLISLLV